jgi:hypothetical protein
MGLISGAAGVAFGAALILLATFFATKNERFDRVAEWLFVAFAALAIPTMVAVAGRLSSEGPAVGVVSAVGIIGVALLGLGELGSSLKLVDFRRIAGAMTIGFLAFLAWIGAVSILAITGGGLPAELGWFGIGTVAVGIAIVLWIVREPGVITGEREPGRTQMTVLFVPMAGIVAWMAWLGTNLG